MIASEYWPWIIVAVVCALGLGVAILLFRRRGQHVDLGSASDIIPAPTLTRDRPETPQIIAPLPQVPPMPVEGDDLRLIKGLGPRIATRLGELGVTHFAQLASLDAAAVANLDAQLGNFAGRITRDSWVEQARYLADGDFAAFEAKFGKLDGETP